MLNRERNKVKGRKRNTLTVILDGKQGLVRYETCGVILQIG